VLESFHPGLEHFVCSIAAPSATIGNSFRLVLARREVWPVRTMFETEMHPDTIAAVTVQLDHWNPYREDVALGVLQKNQPGAACSIALPLYREHFLLATVPTFRRK
jgi:hypothetical protein